VELVDANTILTDIRHENGLTLHQALGWHRLPSVFNELRKKAHSLSTFEAQEIEDLPRANLRL
jgi:hypothetical protein